MIAVIVISILTIITFLLGAVIGVTSIIVMIGSFRGDRSKSLTDPPPTHAETITRRILGVGVRSDHEGTDENA
jgi:hypothetical protein